MGAQELQASEILRRPSLQVIEGNEETYSCLSEYPDRPLVMFTDQTEVEFRAAMLGSVLSNKGTSFFIARQFDPESYKVYLAQNSTAGQDLMRELNGFLTTIIANGLYQTWKDSSLS